MVFFRSGSFCTVLPPNAELLGQDIESMRRSSASLRDTSAEAPSEPGKLIFYWKDLASARLDTGLE